MLGPDPGRIALMSSGSSKEGVSPPKHHVVEVIWCSRTGPVDDIVWMGLDSTVTLEPVNRHDGTPAKPSLWLDYPSLVSFHSNPSRPTRPKQQLK